MERGRNGGRGRERNTRRIVDGQVVEVRAIEIGLDVLGRRAVHLDRAARRGDGAGDGQRRAGAGELESAIGNVEDGPAVDLHEAELSVAVEDEDRSAVNAFEQIIREGSRAGGEMLGDRARRKVAEEIEDVGASRIEHRTTVGEGLVVTAELRLLAVDIKRRRTLNRQIAVEQQVAEHLKRRGAVDLERAAECALARRRAAHHLKGSRERWRTADGIRVAIGLQTTSAADRAEIADTNIARAA